MNMILGDVEETIYLVEDAAGSEEAQAARNHQPSIKVSFFAFLDSMPT